MACSYTRGLVECIASHCLLENICSASGGKLTQGTQRKSTQLKRNNITLTQRNRFRSSRTGGTAHHQQPHRQPRLDAHLHQHLNCRRHKCRQQLEHQIIGLPPVIRSHIRPFTPHLQHPQHPPTTTQHPSNTHQTRLQHPIPPPPPPTLPPLQIRPNTPSPDPNIFPPTATHLSREDEGGLLGEDGLHFRHQIGVVVLRHLPGLLAAPGSGSPATRGRGAERRRRNVRFRGANGGLRDHRRPASKNHVRARVRGFGVHKERGRGGGSCTEHVDAECVPLYGAVDRPAATADGYAGCSGIVVLGNRFRTPPVRCRTPGNC